MNSRKQILFSLLLMVFLQGCFRAQTTNNELPTVEVTATTERPTSTITSAPLPSATVTPTVAEVLPTPPPNVTITAVGGNLYIRRGPGFEYDPIAVLTKGSSADVIGQDVLSKWAQVNIPDSDRTGWVSLMSTLTQVTGELSQVPDFTFTDWAKPAYVKNCTEHNIYIMPGEVYLYNLYTNSKYLNEAQVNPGTYRVYDVSLPDEPEIQIIEVREGVTVYITVNGLGVEHDCP